MIYYLPVFKYGDYIYLFLHDILSPYIELYIPFYIQYIISPTIKDGAFRQSFIQHNCKLPKICHLGSLSPPTVILINQ